MEQQGRSPILIEMDAQNIDAERREAEREALAQRSAPAQRRPHILDLIRRLVAAIQRADR
jgi:hypothetical protein